MPAAPATFRQLLRTAPPGTGAPARPVRTWRFRHDVQGIRGLAILLVVLYHARLGWLTGGYLGVDVFFVLSGFLITGIALEEIDRTGRLSLARFWGRRARRLLPAALTMLAVTLALAAWISSPFVLGLHARTALLSALYASNLLFLSASADYFAINTQPNLLLHTWSLSVEEQFYLCFAPLLAVLALVGAHRGPAPFRRSLAWLLAALVVASFVLCVTLARSNRVMAFYLLPARLWELGVGALVAMHGDALAARVRSHASTLAWAAVLAVLGAAMYAGERTAHPGWLTVVPVLGTALLLVVGTSPAPPLANRWLATPTIGRIGLWSYSWYLWHWPMLVLFDEVIGRSTATQRILVLVASLGVARASFRWVEAPIHRSPTLARFPRLSLATALAASACVAFAARKVWARGDRAAEAPQLTEVRASAARPPFGCMGQLRLRDGGLCEFGSPEASRTVVMFGDSHMAQWFAALEPVAAADSVRLVAVVKSGCPAAAVPVEANVSHRPFIDCDLWRERAMRLIDSLHPDLVLVSSWHRYGVMVDGATRMTVEDDEAQQAWEHGMDSTLHRLSSASGRVVVIRDTPMPGIIVRDCLTTRFAQADRCAVPLRVAEDSVIASIERAVATDIAGVGYADLNDSICDTERCPAIRDDVVVFRDTHHLSNTFVATLEPQLRDLVRESFSRLGARQDWTDSARATDRGAHAGPGID